MVFRIAHRVCGNPMDAEDVLQTVFLRLVRREEGLDPQRDPERYLARAATNASLDVLRSRGVRPVDAIDEARLELLPAGAASPERQQIGRQLRDELRRALGRLHPRTAEVFVLRFIEGYGNREIAAILGTSPASIAVSIFRAKSQLKRELAGALGGLS
jgi:RNA polymerase sigma-70 factor (ECF subfamily)